jgi:hypothetical protein
MAPEGKNENIELPKPYLKDANKLWFADSGQ